MILEVEYQGRSKIRSIRVSPTLKFHSQLNNSRALSFFFIEHRLQCFNTWWIHQVKLIPTHMYGQKKIRVPDMDHFVFALILHNLHIQNFKMYKLILQYTGNIHYLNTETFYSKIYFHVHVHG